MTSQCSIPDLMAPHDPLARLFRRLAAAHLIEPFMPPEIRRQLTEIFGCIETLSRRVTDITGPSEPLPLSPAGPGKSGLAMGLVASRQRAVSQIADLLDARPRCSALAIVEFANTALGGTTSSEALTIGAADRPGAQDCVARRDGRGERDGEESSPREPEDARRDRATATADLSREGIEYLGTYTLFHLDGAAWGIRLYVDRIAHTANELAPVVGLAPAEACATLLVHVLLHEWHHFVEEIAGSLFELDLGRPLVAPFHREVYEKTRPDVLNEALANAFALSELPRHLQARAPVIDKARRLAIETMDRCPPAYSRYGEFPRAASRPACGPYGAGFAAWLLRDVLRSALPITFDAPPTATSPVANSAGVRRRPNPAADVLARTRRAGAWPIHAAVPVRLLAEAGELAGTFSSVMAGA